MLQDRVQNILSFKTPHREKLGVKSADLGGRSEQLPLRHNFHFPTTHVNSRLNS